MRTQEETLFTPPTKEKTPSFKCLLKATSEHKAEITNAFDPTGKKLPVLSKEAITVALDKPTWLLVKDDRKKVYAPSVPDDTNILVEIIDEEDPQKGVFGYVAKGRFKQEVPQETNLDQQKFPEIPEEDEFPF